MRIQRRGLAFVTLCLVLSTPLAGAAPIERATLKTAEPAEAKGGLEELQTALTRTASALFPPSTAPAVGLEEAWEVVVRKVTTNADATIASYDVIVLNADAGTRRLAEVLGLRPDAALTLLREHRRYAPEQPWTQPVLAVDDGQRVVFLDYAPVSARSIKTDWGTYAAHAGKSGYPQFLASDWPIAQLTISVPWAVEGGSPLAVTITPAGNSEELREVPKAVNALIVLLARRFSNDQAVETAKAALYWWRGASRNAALWRLEEALHDPSFPPDHLPAARVMLEVLVGRLQPVPASLATPNTMWQVEALLRGQDVSIPASDVLNVKRMVVRARALTTGLEESPKRQTLWAAAAERLRSTEIADPEGVLRAFRSHAPSLSDDRLDMVLDGVVTLIGARGADWLHAAWFTLADRLNVLAKEDDGAFRAGWRAALTFERTTAIALQMPTALRYAIATVHLPRLADESTSIPDFTTRLTAVRTLYQQIADQPGLDWTRVSASRLWDITHTALGWQAEGRQFVLDVQDDEQHLWITEAPTSPTAAPHTAGLEERGVAQAREVAVAAWGQVKDHLPALAISWDQTWVLIFPESAGALDLAAVAAQSGRDVVVEVERPDAVERVRSLVDALLPGQNIPVMAGGPTVLTTTLNARGWGSRPRRRFATRADALNELGLAQEEALAPFAPALQQIREAFAAAQAGLESGA